VARIDRGDLHDTDDAAACRVFRIEVDRRVELLEPAVHSRALLHEAELDRARVFGDGPAGGTARRGRAERERTDAHSDDAAEMSNLAHSLIPRSVPRVVSIVSADPGEATPNPSRHSA